MEKDEKIISKKSYEVLRLAVDTVIVNMRFMDVAINRLKSEEKKGLMGAATDLEHFFYDSNFLLQSYVKDTNLVTRIYLHSLLHCVFLHPMLFRLYLEDKNQTIEFDAELFELCVDISVENIILEFEVKAFELVDDAERVELLRGLKKYLSVLTPERIYKYYLVNPLSKADRIRMSDKFTMDRHIYWYKQEDYEISDEMWKKISERIKADIGTFSKNSNHSDSLIKNLIEATKEKQDLRYLLSRFASMGEELKINDDEFDYIYYNYGMSMYGNVPLVEALEYKDEKKVRDFAICIDTSASCQGETIKEFLRTAFDALKNNDNVSDKTNIHILQCDNQVQSDTLITDMKELDEYIETGRLYGFGGTDFRPAFEYIDKLIEEKAFSDFRGLIYFTDGRGIYPFAAPGYDTMFVFKVDAADEVPSVPWWAIKVVI